ncbi:branched-chain amino acid ABC transporter permease [Paenibacillus sediminis]|uniref:Branched-chain amino acid transport system permease protein n=1 Tax=Paenibacillus sediminis TaxID=664909 RepID=A0ABS4GYA1_9BACL|nr:branched-chain amino acid ABC transporter permease [Paenibacillus sediminis]MBP1935252.1 branched-chain amino acid transport system permease protein [Paenibacillus sediminis]
MKKMIFPAAIAVLLLILPVMLTSYGIKLTAEVFIMSIFVLSLGLITGYAGLVSLGHAAFFGIGAYTIALLGKFVPNTFVLLASAIIFAALIALLTGFLFIRSSGAYFLMITLAFSQMLYAVAYKLKGVTGGSDGMSVAASLDFGFGPISGSMGLYYVMAVSVMICYVLLRMFINSPAGKAIIGVKENESRMRALGYSVRSYKLLAYTISGGIAGYAGGLYAFYNYFVSPDTLNWNFSGQVLVMIIIGGVGTLFGPPIGAAVFVILQNYISSYTERWPMIMGVIFVAFVLYGRGGIANLLLLAWRKISRRQKEINSPALNSSEKISKDETKGVTEA